MVPLDGLKMLSNSAIETYTSRCGEVPARRKYAHECVRLFGPLQEGRGLVACCDLKSTESGLLTKFKHT